MAMCQDTCFIQLSVVKCPIDWEVVVPSEGAKICG